ncbi:MAG: hypothetical protein DCC68_06030 [Planctomycetota bacterium]|nr:MAG: hypothetical protein DCC68_06030 [Planctomycetota bacterium]
MGGFWVSTGGVGGVASAWAAAPWQEGAGGHGSQQTGRQRRIRPNSRQAVAVSTSITTATVQTKITLAI